MHDIRLIATDLDRTLLRHDKTISSYSLRVLSALRKQGIRLVYASARPIRSIRPYTDILPADAILSHNGARTLAGNQCIYRRSVSPEDTHALLSSIEAQFPTLTLSCEIDDTLYANFDPSGLWEGMDYKKLSYESLPARPADKLIVGITSAQAPQDMLYTDITSVAAQLAPLLPSHLCLTITENKLCMITHREATKFHGLQAVAAHFQVPMAHIAAFGDDYNDVEMLRAAGFGIAVANAIDEARAAADGVTLTNEEDGVAHWLASHLSIPSV